MLYATVGNIFSSFYSAVIYEHVVLLNEAINIVYPRNYTKQAFEMKHHLHEYSR